MTFSAKSIGELETLSKIVDEIKPTADFIGQIDEITARIGEIIHFNRCIILHDRQGKASSRGFVYRGDARTSQPGACAAHKSFGPPIRICRYVSCFDTSPNVDRAFYWRAARRPTIEMDPRAADLLHDMQGSEGVAATVRTVVDGTVEETLLQLEYDTAMFSMCESLLVSFIAFHLHAAFTVQSVEVSMHGGLVGIRLTVKEKEVLKWVIEGKTSWEISRILDTSERTVKFHLKNVYSKLRVSNRAQAVAKAGRLGIV